MDLFLRGVLNFTCLDRDLYTSTFLQKPPGRFVAFTFCCWRKLDRRAGRSLRTTGTFVKTSCDDVDLG